MIGGQTWPVLSRTGERYICRAIMGPVVESGQAVRLSPHALNAARALSAGLTGYHWDGPPEFQVRRLE